MNYNTKLKNCRVMTSHNTCIGKTQLFGKAKTQRLMEILNLGCRMLEFDIFSDHNQTPLISHGKKIFGHYIRFVKGVPLEDCLRIISNQAWKNTDYPLFIYMELKLKNGLERVERCLKKYLGNRLLIDLEKNLGEYTIDELRGKCLLVVNFAHELTDLSCGYVYGNNRIMNNFSEKTKQVKFNRLTRIYPNNFFTSTNFDVCDFVNANFPALNFHYKDDNYNKYLSLFAQDSIIPF